MYFKRKVILISIFMMSALVSYADEASDKTNNEIKHMLSYLKSSGCRFYRNGKWYNSDRAVEHMQNKLQYLYKKKSISSSEDFITLVATKSSVSGETYLVECGTNKPVASSMWFKAELKRYRSLQLQKVGKE